MAWLQRQDVTSNGEAVLGVRATPVQSLLEDRVKLGGVEPTLNSWTGVLPTD